MKLYLLLAKGPHDTVVTRVDVDLFLIGRDPMCQLRNQDPRIEPQHCAIVKKDDRKFFVRDLANGETVLNGELIPPGEEWPLHAGDRLELGPFEFLIQFNEVSLSKKDVEEWALKCLDADAEKGSKEEDDDDEFEAYRALQDAADAAAGILDRLQAQRGIVKGRLRISELDDVTVARFNDAFLVDPGEISMIKSELISNFDRHGMRVLLDFKNVWRMSSSAAEMILEIRLRLRHQDSSLAMCRLRPELQPVLRAMHIHEKVPHFDDKKVALMAKW